MTTIGVVAAPPEPTPSDVQLPGQIADPASDDEVFGEGGSDQGKVEGTTSIRVGGTQMSISNAQISEKDLKLLKTMDGDGDGDIELHELVATINAKHEKEKHVGRLKKVILGVIGLSMFIVLANSFATVMVVEYTKEMQMSNDGNEILAMDGSPARVASSDLEVCEDGTLVAASKKPKQGAKQESNFSMPLATRPAETKRSLSSTIPDKLFDEMEKLTINGADGISHMTLKIHAFARVLAPSKCGSLVHLSTLHGTATLDDTILSFDEQLSERAKVLGIPLEGLSVHGRRLAAGTEVAGIFNFFEDYDWQCDSIAKPKSPEKPYIMKTVKRVPCIGLSQCSSSMDGSIRFPGYDEETSSIIVTETMVETDDFSLSIQRFPNHPLQSLVTVADHKRRTHHTSQVFSGSAYHCFSQNYTTAVGNATDSLDSYFAAYLGHETRPASKFDLPWGSVIVPEKKVRAFRLQPREGVDGALPIPIDYDDDAQTLLPARILFHGADQLSLDVEEILVEEFQPNAQEAATALRRKFNLPCNDHGSSNVIPNNVPIMDSPITEVKADVQFYANHYLESDDLEKNDQELEAEDFGMGGKYWALAILKQEALDDSQNASRRLSSLRKRRLLEQGFEVDLDDETSISAMWSGKCMELSGAGGSKGSPWSVSGSISMGPLNSGCNGGSVAITYSWGIEKETNIKVNLLFTTWKCSIKFECGLSITGHVGYKVGTYNYNCGRRLGTFADPITMNTTDSIDTNPSVLGSESPSSDSAPPRLLGGRRRRRRRRRSCSAPGFQVETGLSVEGGCGVKTCAGGIGVSLEGNFNLALGPFPTPLDARALGKIAAKACFKIGPWKGCIGLSDIELFNLDI